ncbi:unnamed protein product [Didymodactylos carnosus]|uniref:Uncharacterized protein n=1 Tax=Didymodactylos carnosus TaxID=1234261 RepID=A0A8S2GVB5_9BILA|nr:unnamed protein product [Didymodactylos carnosus]CAF3561578.1 unnamed protein product [Didymodactylos carnosus]
MIKMLFDTAVLLPLPILGIVGSVIFGLILIYAIGCKTFFPSSPSKTESSSASSKKQDSKHRSKSKGNNEEKGVSKTNDQTNINKKQQSTEKSSNKKSVPKPKVVVTTDSGTEQDEPPQKSTKKSSSGQKQQQNISPSKSSASKDVAPTNQSKQQTTTKTSKVPEKKQQSMEKDAQHPKQLGEIRSTVKEAVNNKQVALEKSNKERSSKHQQYEENFNGVDENEEDLFVTKGAKSKTKSTIAEKNKNTGKEQQQQRTREQTGEKLNAQGNRNVENNQTQQQTTTKQVDSKLKAQQPVQGQQQTETKLKKEKHTAHVEGVEGHNDDADHEDDGQWLTQGASKQVSNRNRKTKSDQVSPNSNEQQKKSSSSKIPVRLNNDVNSKTSPTHTSATNRHNGSDNRYRETMKSDITTSLASSNLQYHQHQPSEPIEICQILPVSTDPYTTNDDWWKLQQTNSKMTGSNNKSFNVHDIGEWPEYVEEEFKVCVKKIIPYSLQTNIVEKQDQQKQAHDADIDDLDDLRVDVDSNTLDTETIEDDDEMQSSLKAPEEDRIGENGEESGEEDVENEDDEDEDESESDEIVSHDQIENEDDTKYNAVESINTATTMDKNKENKIKSIKNDEKQPSIPSQKTKKIRRAS